MGDTPVSYISNSKAAFRDPPNNFVRARPHKSKAESVATNYSVSITRSVEKEANHGLNLAWRGDNSVRIGCYARFLAARARCPARLQKLQRTSGYHHWRSSWQKREECRIWKIYWEQTKYCLIKQQLAAKRPDRSRPHHWQRHHQSPLITDFWQWKFESMRNCRSNINQFIFFKLIFYNYF